jgi:hypothetical protein
MNAVNKEKQDRIFEQLRYIDDQEALINGMVNVDSDIKDRVHKMFEAAKEIVRISTQEQA